MLRRIYFLAPDVAVAARVVDDLLLARVEARHLHVLAKRGTPLGDLPEASVLQKSDFVPALERGIALGGSAGIIAGLVGLAVPGAAVVAGGILLATTLSGASVGAWLGGMVGMSKGSSRLEQFESAIESGQVLVMADVPQHRVHEIEARVRSHLPEAQIEGTEPHMPAFP